MAAQPVDRMQQPGFDSDLRYSPLSLHLKTEVWKSGFVPLKTLLLKLKLKILIWQFTVPFPSPLCIYSNVINTACLAHWLPEIANPLNPTARTKKEMAIPFVWEKPTTSRRVASIPKPESEPQTLSSQSKQMDMTVQMCCLLLSLKQQRCLCTHWYDL